MSQLHQSCNKRTLRDRYYSSMNYDEYFILFGPPTPLVKPLEDPLQDIPELCLEYEQMIDIEPNADSRNFQFQKLDLSFKKQLANNSSNTIKTHHNSTTQGDSIPDISHVAETQQASLDLLNMKNLKLQRPRSKSDNAEYLIFSFLEKINKKGKKKIKQQ